MYTCRAIPPLVAAICSAAEILATATETITDQYVRRVALASGVIVSMNNRCEEIRQSLEDLRSRIFKETVESFPSVIDQRMEITDRWAREATPLVEEYNRIRQEALEVREWALRYYTIVNSMPRCTWWA